MANKYWKLKFYLSKGPYFRHWQIRGRGKELHYFNPANSSLLLYSCKLVNKINSANKTFNGANRQPCAWVFCDSWEEVPATTAPEGFKEIFYNPKVCPHWRNKQEENIDNRECQKVITVANKIFVNKIEENRQIVQQTFIF